MYSIIWFEQYGSDQGPNVLKLFLSVNYGFS
jgi:hypothetical protein